MFLVAHGGHCCGIKTIFGLMTDPANYADAMTGQQLKAMVGGSVYSGNPRPAETYGDRFEAYINYQMKAQNKGIIEVVLIDSQIKNWQPLLDKYDFKETFSGYNSNSGNIVHIFHKAYAPKPKVKADPKATVSLRG